MRGNIQDMQISGAFPIIFGVLGGKGFEKDGAHMFRAFAYLPMHDLHTEKFASRVHTRGGDERLPTGRSKEIRVSVRPPHPLVSSSHRYVYDCLLKGYGRGGGAWEGPRRRNNILREQNSSNTFVPDLRRIIPLFSLCGNPNVFSFSLCTQSIWAWDFQVET